jgi:hypothetical protein
MRGRMPPFAQKCGFLRRNVEDLEARSMALLRSLHAHEDDFELWLGV